MRLKRIGIVLACLPFFTAGCSEGFRPLNGLAAASLNSSSTTSVPDPAPAPTSESQPESPPVPAPTPSVTSVRIAGENQNFTVPSNTVVYYGALFTYVQRTISGSGTCTSADFGTADPAFGIPKACYTGGPPNQSPINSPQTTPAPAALPVVLSIGCGKAVAANATGVIYNVPISAAGRNRDYNIIVPTDYNPNEPLPILIGAHGSGGNSTDAMTKDFAKIRSATKAERAIYIFANGPSGWDESCGGADMAYYQAMIAAVSNQYCVNTNRVFAYGFSWGGGVTNSAACCLGNKVRAVMPFSGTDTGFNTSQCVAPMPAYRTYLGTSDMYFSSSDLNSALNTMASLSKCTSSQTTEVGKGCEGANYNSNLCSRRIYSGCQQEVSGTTITGMPHMIADQYPELIWNFFSRYK